MGRSVQLRSSVVRRLLDAFWLLILMGYVLAGVPLTPFHGDEATLVYMSHDYAYQFIDRDLSLIAYQPQPSSPQEQELRLLNGTINKYSIGLAWHLAGFTAADLNEQWDWGADWNYNQQYGHAPSAALLLIARLPSALFTALSVVVMFGIAYTLAGRPAAYLASLFFALNPAILLNGRRAMMEGSLFFFALLVVLVGIWFVRRRSWRAALALGLAGGLALASKHTALFTVGSVYLACGLLPLLARDSRTQLGRYYAQLFAAGLLTMVMFLALNPAWWGANPLDVGRYVLDLREQVLQTQINAFGSYPGWPERITGFWQQALNGTPQYYEASNWVTFIPDQIAAYEGSPWKGIFLGEVGGLALALLSLFGFWCLLRTRARDFAGRWLIISWALLTCGGVLLLTPLEWQRYYLPALPILLLLAALGTQNILNRIWEWVGKQKLIGS